MDIVKLLRRSVDQLPQGDHTVGLLSVLRHIDAAVRHFERGNRDEEDAYTDAIYRANQAFEGSLKEAYRVMTGSDPAGMTPHQIENYLEQNKAVRNRVLVQLTRYRHDYRNPSTHDYKLDFDEDESLLAILSVTAFAKLLVDQISEKLAFSAAEAGSADQAATQLRASINPARKNFNLEESVVGFLQQALSWPETSALESPELEGTLAGLLSSTGLKADLNVPIDGEVDDGMEWDILISHKAKRLPVEVRVSYSLSSARLTLMFASRMLTEKKVESIVVAFTSRSAGPYIITEIPVDRKKLYVVHTEELNVGSIR